MHQLPERWCQHPTIAAMPATENTPERKQKYGLEDGEKVITEGHFRILSALAQLPPGVELPVIITELDGEKLSPHPSMMPPGAPGAAPEGASNTPAGAAAQAAEVDAP